MTGTSAEPDETEYFYLRALYVIGGQLYAYGDQWGSITTQPIEAYKRHGLNHERRMRENHGIHVDRTGGLFAVWRLPSKLSREEALALAQATRPWRIYLCASESWDDLLALALPEGTEIEVPDPYPYPGMRKKR